MLTEVGLNYENKAFYPTMVSFGKLTSSKWNRHQLDLRFIACI